MTNEYGFEVAPSEVYEDRLDELLDRLELQEGGAIDTVTTQAARASALDGLRGFALSSYPLTIANALSILKLIGQYHEIPWRIGYTILEHEAGVEGFEHHDGVMQTTSAARNTTIPRIPHDLKLALLGLPPGDHTTDARLNQMLKDEFPRSLAVQLATGMQELKDNLQTFSGYVALAWQAFNAGAGWGFYTATAGAGKQRPRGVSDTDWEDMCRYGAFLMHQLPGEVRVGAGVWQCDANMPGWFKSFKVQDKTSNLTLVSYQYLRSINACICSQMPNIPCDWPHHKQRNPGSGPTVCRGSRDGALDKLYNPAKLRRAYYDAVRSELKPIVPEDSLPLKVLNGQLVKMPLVSSVHEVSGDAIPEVFPELTDEYSFEVGPSEVYEDRLEALLDRLELQESGGYEATLSEQWEAAQLEETVGEQRLVEELLDRLELEVAKPLVVKLVDPGIEPQADEAASKWTGDVVHLEIDGQPGIMPAPISGDEYKMPSDGVQRAMVTSVEKRGPHRSPVVWRLVSGGNTPLQPGIAQAVQLSTRLRFSIFDFNPSFVKRPLSSSGKTVGVELDTNLLDRVKDARVDDYSLVRTISFGGEASSHDARPPQWANFSPAGFSDEAVRVDYLQKLTSEMHVRGVQVIAGYELVERGKQVTSQGTAFRSWLSQATQSQVAAHAKAIDDFFTSRNIAIDGIGFDFELNLFRGAALGQNLALLLKEMSNAMARRNGIVYYDTAPFQPNDGEGSSPIMTLLGYSKANVAPNLIARPMCYNGSLAPFSTVKASIAAALRSIASKGGGVHPAQLQCAIDWLRMSKKQKDEVTKWCRDLFRPNRVGVVIYTMPGGKQAQARLLANCAIWEAALNPGEAAPGTTGQPLQVPRPGNTSNRYEEILEQALDWLERHEASTARPSTIGWPDAPRTRPATGEKNITVPSSGWNSSTVRVGGIDRIPLDGLSEANPINDHYAAAAESPVQRAIALVPYYLNRQNTNIDVLLHLHGFNIGYRQSKAGGFVRDIDRDRFEQQLEAWGNSSDALRGLRLRGERLVAVLAQGTTKSNFGTGAEGMFRNADAYLTEILRGLQGALPQGVHAGRIILSAHSGAGRPLSKMLESGNVPSNLSMVILFDAINSDLQLRRFADWIQTQIKNDVAKLTGQSEAAQLIYLSRSMRFRAYFSDASFYQNRYKSLQVSLASFLQSLAKTPPLVSQRAVAALTDNYRVVKVGGDHDGVVGNPTTVFRGARPLEVALAKFTGP